MRSSSRSLYGGGSQRHRRHRLSTATALALLFLASASTITSLSITSPHLSGGVVEESGKSSGSSELMEEITNRRRQLSRLGSAPPSCRAKCGRCTPCKPVRVPIQPGRSMVLEYYPEAWRCKCGNNLFMP